MNTRALDVNDQTVASMKAHDPGLGAYKFDNLATAMNFAKVMAQADVMLPPFLRNNVPLCLGITMRALHWDMDPFGLATTAYQAQQGGMVGFEAKVFVAALEQCTGIELEYEFSGSYDVVNEPIKSRKGNVISPVQAKGDRQCTAFAIVNGTRKEYVSPKLDDIPIKNSPLWHNDPDQALSYYTGRGWTRRYKPGVIMGAYSSDEVSNMAPLRDVTPKQGGFVKMTSTARTNLDSSPEKHVEEKATTHNSGEVSEQEERDIETNNEADEHNAEYLNGVEAAKGGLSRSDCPYRDDPERAQMWFSGFDEFEPVEVDQEDVDDDAA